MSEEKVLEWGIKENYKHFKDNFNFMFSDRIEFFSPLFVYNSDDPELAYVFHTDHELKVFLESVWYDNNYADRQDMANSMSEWFVWKFVNEKELERWSSLHKGAKLTSITCNGMKMYRERKKIEVEPCIYISLN